MESFFYIAQKVMSPNIEPYIYKDDFTSKCEFTDFLRKTTFPMPSVKTFFYNYVIHEKRNIRKFKLLQSIIENIFCSEQFKEQILDLFCSIQKVERALSKFAYVYKYKKATIKIKTDMYLNPIKFGDKNVMCIFDDKNSCSYLFTINDLIQIIKKSLIHSPNFFSDPSESKNPYTNLPFNKSTLYNIYFFIKQKNFIMPTLIQNFFIENFDLENFRKNNTQIIRECAIKDFVDNIEPSEAEIYISTMLKSYRKKKHNIDFDFPKNKLLEIMRPYLHYYFIASYSLCMEKRHEYFHKLFYKLKRFFDFNPCFGRRYCKMQRASTDCQINPFDPINKIKKRIVIFDDDHIHFHEKANNTFLTSHKKTDGYLEEDEDESNNQPREPSLEDDDYSAFTEDSSEDVVNENIPPEEEEVVDEENEYDIRIANAQEILNDLHHMQNETEEQNETDSVS
jgi:hypothetical protein